VSAGRLRIGIFTDYYLPSMGGTEVAVRNHREMLESLGHEVFVVTADDPARDGADPNIVGLRSVSGPPDFNRVAVPPRGATRDLRRLRLDVVHTHTPFTTGLLADMVARDRDVPLVQTVHTLIPEMAAYHRAAAAVMMPVMAATFYPFLARTGRRRLATTARLPADIRGVQALSWRLMIASANTATVLTTPSAHLDRRMRAYGLARPNVVLPNALDTRTYRVPQALPDGLRLPPADVRIVSVGRMTPEKRPLEVVRAFAGLGAREGLQLVMVGAGPKLEECRRLARSLGVGDRVVFTGLQEPRTVAVLLQASDVFVLASKGFDNQPMVILEAAAAGLPIVYCDPALTEGLTPANSLLAGDGPDGLTAAFAALVTDPALRKSMAQASLEQSEAFDVSAMRHRLADVYDQALRLHRARV
jgi:1,2-diacylglycerol 3-alpha-glucosyltransferase